nr:hypothetical protein [Bacillus sp. EB600]
MAVSISDRQSLTNSRVRLDEAGVYDLSKTSILEFIEGIAQDRFWDRQQ